MLIEMKVMATQLPYVIGLALFLLIEATAGGPVLEVAPYRPATPLDKAIQMLSNVKKAAESEKHDEQVQYGAYEQFCSDITLEKQHSIRQGTAEAQKLEADVEKFDTRAAGLSDDIDVYNKEIASWTADIKAADEVRVAEQGEYELTHHNYTESVEALMGAIQVLKAQQYDRQGTYAASAALVQLRKLLDAKGHEELRSAVTALLQQHSSEEPDLTFQPPVTAYEFKSGDIIKMLEDLHKKFSDELTDLDKAEVDRNHAYTMFKQGCEKSITAAQDSIVDKEKTIAKYKQQSLVASQDLQIVRATLEDDQKYLADLTKTCGVKAEEFRDRQQSRTEEIQALEKALELLKSDELAGLADKHMSAAVLAQLSKGSALVQMQHGQDPHQSRVAEFLRDASSRLHSADLSALATAVQSSQGQADPFGKVKALIEELIQRLMTQAVRETEHKGWCDTQLATNAQTRKTKSEEIETLSAEIESLDAEVAQLGKEVSELQVEVEEIDAAVENATELREAERNESMATIVEAQTANAALGQVIQLLQDYYAKAAEHEMVATNSTVLMQQDPPPIFESEPYQGQQAASGGVIGILQVLQSDFARLESDTRTAETLAQEDYDTFMEDSAISKAQKESDIKHKDGDRKVKEAALPQRREDLQKAQELLQTAEESHDKLRPVCIVEPMSWDERTRRREQEIEALKQALDILEDATPV